MEVDLKIVETKIEIKQKKNDNVKDGVLLEVLNWNKEKINK